MTGPTPNPPTTFEEAERERLAREKEEGKRRAAVMVETRKIERLIVAAHNELARRGEHAGAHEVAEFLVVNGVRQARGAETDRLIVPESWPRFGLGEPVRADDT